MKRTLYGSIAAVMLATAPAVSHASDGSWLVGDSEIHLKYSDIDLRTPAGRAVMLARSERAARKLCRDALGSERAACVIDTLRNVTGRDATALALAQSERKTVALASR